MKMKSFALASALSLGLIAAFSVINDRQGFLSSPNVLDVGRQYLPTRDVAKAAQGTGCLPTTGTVSGLTFAQGVNAAIAALISSNSGASAPATDCTAAAVKGQVWLDTSSTPNLLKQYDGASWVVLGALDSANHLWAPPIGGGTAALTAASTTDLWSTPATSISISGTTTITAFANASAVPGSVKVVTAGAAFAITHNATSLELPSGASLTAAVGDRFLVIAKTATNVAVFAYTRADGSSIVNPSVPMGTVLYGDYGTIPPKTVYGAGQALSRASYPGYLAAVTRAQSGTLTSGSATITSVANTAGLGAGMPVEGTGVQSGTTIVSVTSSTIVMSQTATTNGVQTVTAFITGYGTGGDSTTVGVKDCRGRALAGRDDMLGTAANRLTSSYFGSSAARIGATGGSESQTLTTAQIPAHTHPNTVSETPHKHEMKTSGPVVPSGPPVYAVVNNVNPSPGTGASSLGYTENATAGVSITNMPNTGGGGAHPIVPPTVIAECVVVVLP